MEGNQHKISPLILTRAYHNNNNHRHTHRIKVSGFMTFGLGLGVGYLLGSKR
jgi:hypothetical protein